MMTDIQAWLLVLAAVGARKLFASLTDGDSVRELSGTDLVFGEYPRTFHSPLMAVRQTVAKLNTVKPA
jgi:hypothetical protein